ncbi:hypothetical protein KY285_024225 [Solanum tuberosum]|nr:hypothetical protein KY289_024560 [Solanum tuberosum]KAH0676424.1 hypothetical protein KY285_024225 [Solanum tuberosum]
MEMLESLDLSRNQLTGRIPTSLARLNFLSVLDLSSNNLSGEIPSSTQLQSFNPSSYAGNNELCGPPLEKCPVHDDHTSRTNNVDEDDDMLLSFGFYRCLLSSVHQHRELDLCHNNYVSTQIEDALELVSKQQAA